MCLLVYLICCFLLFFFFLFFFVCVCFPNKTNEMKWNEMKCYSISTQFKSLRQTCSAERHVRTSIKESISVDEMRLVVTVHSHWSNHQSYHLHLVWHGYQTHIVDLCTWGLRSRTRFEVAWCFAAAGIMQQAMVRVIACRASIMTFAFPWHVTSPQAVETIPFDFLQGSNVGARVACGNCRAYTEDDYHLKLRTPFCLW